MSGGRTRSVNAATQYAKLAKNAAEHYVKNHEQFPLSATLPPELMRQYACYVYVYEEPGHHLRVSHGYPLPRQRSVAEEIIVNTTHAVAGMVRRVDLSYLHYQVAILKQLQRITQPEHLDPSRFGLYVRSERDRTALVLPQRIGIDTPQDQIATALREAQIDPRQETPVMYRVEVTYYE